jgi:hypothetical protein
MPRERVNLAMTPWTGRLRRGRIGQVGGDGGRTAGALKRRAAMLHLADGGKNDEEGQRRGFGGCRVCGESLEKGLGGLLYAMVRHRVAISTTMTWNPVDGPRVAIPVLVPASAQSTTTSVRSRHPSPRFTFTPCYSAARRCCGIHLQLETWAISACCAGADGACHLSPNH